MRFVFIDLHALSGDADAVLQVGGYCSVRKGGGDG